MSMRFSRSRFVKNRRRWCPGVVTGLSGYGLPLRLKKFSRNEGERREKEKGRGRISITRIGQFVLLGEKGDIHDLEIVNVLFFGPANQLRYAAAVARP